MSAVRIPHRCARNERCSNRVRIDHDPACTCQCHGQNALDATCDVEGGCGSNTEGLAWFEGGAILTPTGLCEACATRVAKALEELPLDYTELHLLLASGESGITSDVVTGSRELQVPIRVSIEALQASMVHELQVWALPVARTLRIAWDANQGLECRPGWVLDRAVRLLTRALNTFLGLPERTYRYALDGQLITRDGIGGALELMRMHDMVRFAAGKTKLIHELPTPCPRCEYHTLVRYNGTDHVLCENCALRWPEEQYKRLCLVTAGDYDEPVHERNRLASCDQGTVGSAAGGFYPSWPKPKMVEFTASSEQVA